MTGGSIDGTNLSLFIPNKTQPVLNLGLNDEIVAGMVAATGNKKWIFDCYRRLIQMYSNVVMGLSNEPFEAVIKKIKKNRVR